MSSSVPAVRGVVIDISATDHVLGNACRGIYVGGAGNLIVKMPGEPATSITLTGVLAGVIYPVQATTVVRTGTTATGLVALY